MTCDEMHVNELNYTKWIHKRDEKDVQKGAQNELNNYQTSIKSC